MDEKIYKLIIGGKSDNNIKYTDFENLIIDLGFKFQRQRGSHELFYNHKIKERLNIQSDGSKAKAYQVRQLRNLILKYNLQEVVMSKYSISIQYDGSDNIYVAYVPELPGCMAHGKTPEDAMKEVKTAIELWIEDAKENKEYIPQPIMYAG